MRWNLYCRVIDNFGDIGVCWRLAADLGSRGDAVRLHVDDASALAWLAPQGASGVSVHAWDAPMAEAEVVIEAFGCELPASSVAQMAAAVPPPLWLNLEYLSAEAWVQRCHALPSPQPSGLRKWFFYPGFFAGTGGLIREDGLLEARRRFDAAAWLAAQGLVRRPGERLATLFCYDNPALPALLGALQDQPTLLLATPGPAQRQCRAWARAHGGGALRIVELPWLPQAEFDRLLWACDLNFVRGEDSLVRAHWAGAPFVWQIYPQHDGAHAPKLQALLDAMLQGSSAGLRADVAALWQAWNGLGPWPARWPETAAWGEACTAWRSQLQAQASLGQQLTAFVQERR